MNIELHRFGGMPVHSNSMCYERVEVPTWIDKILMWNPCNTFLILRWEEVPTAYFAMVAGQKVLIAHPCVIEGMRNIT